MKKLPEFTEERWQLQALAVMDGVIRAPAQAKEAFLLLHGLNERGRRIYRKLLSFLPKDALIIAPNAPFPLPRQTDTRIDYGFSWYFYDRFDHSYFIDQNMAKSWIKELLHLKVPRHLPLTIIGFSQGGYLAPIVAKELPEAWLVIGIGCEFRHNLITGPLHFRLEAIHGKDDPTVLSEWALAELAHLKAMGIDSGWHVVENTAHEITPEIGHKLKEILEAHGKRSL